MGLIGTLGPSILELRKECYDFDDVRFFDSWYRQDLKMPGACSSWKFKWLIVSAIYSILMVCFTLCKGMAWLDMFCLYGDMDLMLRHLNKHECNAIHLFQIWSMPYACVSVYSACCSCRGIYICVCLCMGSDG